MQTAGAVRAVQDTQASFDELRRLGSACAMLSVRQAGHAFVMPVAAVASKGGPSS